MLPDPPPPDIVRLAATLNNPPAVKWVLVGGMALTLWGGDHRTGDADMMIDFDPENIERLVLALRQLRAKPLRAPSYDPDMIDRKLLSLPFVQLDTDAGRVDLINRTGEGTSYGEIFASAECFDLGGQQVWVASLESLEKMETGTPRTKDVLQLNQIQALIVERSRTQDG